jgi:GAF domain-containing protein
MTLLDLEIPEALQRWAASDGSSDERLWDAVRLYGEALGAGRCILYARQPELRRANTTHAWWSEDQFAPLWESWFVEEWVDEGPPNAEDPLYAAALRDPSPVYIGDITNDPTGLINLEFEERVFLHRGLIHAPIYHEGRFYGILEPSAFGEPRVWTDQDRAITVWMQEHLGPIVADYVATHGPKPE